MYILLLLRQIAKTLSKRETAKVAYFLLLLCVVSIWVMSTAEKWSILNTFYWFFITITTVGYGDLAPTQPFTRVFTVFVLLTGMGAVALLAGNTASGLLSFRRKKMKGLGDYSAEKGHIVLMGWHGERTLRMIENMFADKSCTGKVILCSESLEEKPEILNGRVEFVKGLLCSTDTLRRAGVRTAAKVLIWGRDDEETALAAIAVAAVDDDDQAEITVMIQSPDNAQHIQNIKRFRGNITVVRSLTDHLLIQEMQDPGLAGIFAELLDNGNTATPYRVKLQYPYEWGNAFKKLWNSGMLPIAGSVFSGPNHGKIIINPEPSITVSEIFVVADKRPSPEDISALLSQEIPF